MNDSEPQQGVTLGGVRFRWLLALGVAAPLAIAPEQPHQLQGGVFGVGDVGFRASTQPTKATQPILRGDAIALLQATKVIALQNQVR